MKIDKKIIFSLIMWALLPAVVSCRQNDLEGPESSGFTGNSEPQISLKINGIGTRSTSSADVKEKIKSLRIMILSDGFVEYNQKIDFTEDPQDAVGFLYKLEMGTVPGNKKFYLFSNEETVENVKFDQLETLPDGITEGMSLTDILDKYPKEKLPSEGTLGYVNSGTGHEFESLINSSYFVSDLAVSNKEIYLPYSSYYSGISADDDEEKTIGGTMYLVPVATKFTFNFKNFRQEGVQLHEIQIRKLSGYNYLMANLDSSEITKRYNGKDYYWIDWLEKVAEDTQAANGSSTSNDRAGWIEKYFMPTDVKENPDYLQQRVESKPSGEEWWADELTNIDNPSTITVVRYFPESLNMGKKSVYNQTTGQYEEIDAQIYEVAFKVQEYRESVIPVEPTQSDWMSLDKVNALFRGTHVVVNVDMYESTVEVYCMIEEWTYNSTPFIGYVQEDDDD